MHFWVKYEFRIAYPGYSAGGHRRVGPFKDRGRAESALIALCGQQHFIGGQIELEPEGQLDTQPCQTR